MLPALSALALAVTVAWDGGVLAVLGAVVAVAIAAAGGVLLERYNGQ